MRLVFIHTRKSNPVRDRVNVRRAAGGTIYSYQMCVMLVCNNKRSNAGGLLCNVKGTANLVLNKV